MRYEEQSSAQAICRLIRLNQFIRGEMALFLLGNPPLYLVSDKNPNDTEPSTKEHGDIYCWFFVIRESELSKSYRSENVMINRPLIDVGQLELIIADGTIIRSLTIGKS